MSSNAAGRWTAVDAALDALLEHPESERGARLSELRARDAALASEVERLLAMRPAIHAQQFLEGMAGSLLATGALHADEAETLPAPTGGGARLAAGDTFGPYRLIRVLGHGGMGIVYEADEVESGRRVALKVLKEALGDARERARFEREGRLAASIDHPNCVFVFGASEIDGHPAIAMELMQGTLADRMKAGGPLAPAAAVDAVLQLLDGLRAAAAAGVLHRDIKPSNCFVDADGVVKIGDFGISRSLRPTEETALSTRGQVPATPAYASPEQLRSGTLDARSDIYSLGATLYELLTGRRPFDGADLMALLMAVANDAPVPPHVLAREIPGGLSKVVVRCLAKQPEQRFPDYDRLAAALEPYSSSASTPATLGRRFLGGAVDHLLLGMPAALVGMLQGPAILNQDLGALRVQQLFSMALTVLYFGVCEALWAATPGKAIAGVTVVDLHGRPPRASNALGRAALYTVPWAAGGVLYLFVGAHEQVSDPMRLNPWSVVASLLAWPLLGCWFSSARRRNGYAAVHDLLTGTRVVQRRVGMPLRRRTRPETPCDAPVRTTQLGGFDVCEGEVEGLPVGWKQGIDVRLRRPVWLRMLPPGSPPVSPSRIRITRATRLRWLAGARALHAWDAFEAVDGRPLALACATTPAWTEVRLWLSDLARECGAHQGEEPVPLRLDRVWALHRGGAKLVDDPIADAADPPEGRPPARLLLDVMTLARRDTACPWPLGAQALMNRLAMDPPPEISEIGSTLATLARQRPAITRQWRGLALALQAGPPLLMMAFITVLMVMFIVHIRRLPPDVLAATAALQRVERAERGRGTLAPADREALTIVLATRYRGALTERGVLSPANALLGIGPDHRRLAERILRRRHTEAESRQAFARPAVQKIVQEATHDDLSEIPLMLAAIFGGVMVFVAGAALASAVLFRGGLLRVIGFDIVAVDGCPASRLRVLARTAIAWSPMLAALGVAIVSGALAWLAPPNQIRMIALAAAPVFLAAGAVAALVRPERGIQDRLAGTWIVPR